MNSLMKTVFILLRTIMMLCLGAYGCPAACPTAKLKPGT